MPFFAIIGRDGPRGADLRKSHREAHLARIEPLAQAGRIRHAGPLLDDTGQPIGSLIVFEADSLEAAQTFAAEDPYVGAGVFESHEVIETRVIFPT